MALLASGMCRCVSQFETLQLDSVYHVILYMVAGVVQ